MKTESMTFNAKELRMILEDVIDDYEQKHAVATSDFIQLAAQRDEWASRAFDHAQAMQRIAHQLQTISNMMFRVGGSDDITITISK